MANRLSALVTALLLPAASPVLVCTAVSTASLLVSQLPAQAQSAEAVAKVAQAITVRVEGATQGSGVLVKRDGNRYTVLTAWHVVSGQKPGEELDVFTYDGQRHQLEQGSIKRLGAVDMAVLTFSSPNAYELARVGDVKSVSTGSPIFVAGFPLPTSAVPTRLMRFHKGDVIGNATVAIPNGYQLLYSNPTLPGMSGGAVLNAQGQLVGIHGQGETDSKMSEQQGITVKTGTNQAVPIAFFSQHNSVKVTGNLRPLKVASAQDKCQAALADASDDIQGRIGAVLTSTERVSTAKWRGDSESMLTYKSPLSNADEIVVFDLASEWQRGSAATRRQGQAAENIMNSSQLTRDYAQKIISACNSVASVKFFYWEWYQGWSLHWPKNLVEDKCTAHGATSYYWGENKCS